MTHFNENELTDKRSFEEKLTEQLDPVSERAKVLMAEVIAVYFFFASSVGGRSTSSLTRPRTADNRSTRGRAIIW